MEEDMEKREGAKTDEATKLVQHMLDIMPFAAFFIGTDYRLLECNRRSIELFSCRNKEEFIANFYRFSPPFQSDGRPSKEKAREMIRKALKEGSAHFYWEHLSAEGRPLYGEIYLFRVEWREPYTAEKSYRILGYLQDLSALRAMEYDLTRMSSVVSASPRMALYINESGKVKYANPAASQITGYSNEELLDKGLELILGSYFTGEFLPNLRKEKEFTFEVNSVHKNGELRVLSGQVFPLKGYSQDNDFALSAEDITEKKRLERELVIAREQAERGLEAARRLDKARNEFISRISHEMRTPLNGILGMSALARNTEDKAGRSRYLEKIHESAENISEAINNILDWVKYESGSFVLAQDVCSLPDIIDSLVRWAEPRAQKKNLQFTLRKPPPLPQRIVTDENSLREALKNLLSNAIKFTPPGGRVELSVSEQAARESKVALEWTISDTGIGISRTMLDMLWEPFEQEQSGRDRKYSGLGLGLPITRGIIKLFSGDIWIDSTPGKGTVCHIIVPVTVISDGPGNDRETGEPVPNAIFAGKRFLVVDDVEINREILVMTLEDAGALTDQAGDGFEAIKLFSHAPGRYAAILMDLHMPGMDGFEAARRIRSSGLPGADLPIIAVSADMGGEIAEQCEAAGMNGHLGKPLDFKALGRILSS